MCYSAIMPLLDHSREIDNLASLSRFFPKLSFLLIYFIFFKLLQFIESYMNGLVSIPNQIEASYW